MRSVDVLVLLGCLLALFFSFPQMQSYRLQLAWEVPLDASVYRNGHTPEPWEQLPQPLMSDVNGDGLRDLVHVTTDYTLRVIDGRTLATVQDETPADAAREHSHSQYGASLHLPEPQAAFEASLLPSVGVKYGRRPVALGAGYLDPEDDEDGVREQVIVVLTEGWVVLCYSSSLELLWESHCVEEVEPLLFHSEATVSISPTPVRNGDRGLVVVAGRMAMRDLSTLDAGHEHFDKEEFAGDEADLIREETGEGIDLKGEVKKPKARKRRSLQEIDDLTHFSYYAFEGHTGEQRWKHEATDFVRRGRNADAKLLDTTADEDVQVRELLVRAAKDLGEVDFTEFREDFLHQLPHEWDSRYDTSLTPEFFDRDRNTGGGTGHSWDDDDDDIFGGAGQQYTGFYGERKTGTKTLANVLVAHNSRGVEAIHYYTGRTLAKLQLRPMSTYADINGDLLIDELIGINEMPKTKRYCIAQASTGMPAVEKLFDLDLCAAPKGLGKKMRQGKKLELQSKKVEMLPPVVMPKSAFSSVVLYLLSDGTLHAVGDEGQKLWKTDLRTSWRTTKTESKPGKKFSLKGSSPSLTPIPRTDGFPSRHILAVGASAMAVVNAKSGSIEFHSEMLAMPVAPVVFGDWDGDGAVDFLIPTGSGLMAYKVEAVSPGNWIYPAVLVALMVAVLLLSCTTKTATKKKTSASFGF